MLAQVLLFAPACIKQKESIAILTALLGEPVRGIQENNSSGG